MINVGVFGMHHNTLKKNISKRNSKSKLVSNFILWLYLSLARICSILDYIGVNVDGSSDGVVVRLDEGDQSEVIGRGQHMLW